MPRIYTRTITNTLTDEQAQHIRVLRLQTGDTIELFDGQGQIAMASIREINKKMVQLEIGEQQQTPAPSSVPLHLAMSLIRNEMMDLTIQKAVELGVSEITPIIAERSQGRLNETQAEKRLAHWHKVMVSACEQSGYNFLPCLNPITAFDSFVATSQGLRIILEPGAQQSFKDLTAPDSTVTLLIGPEGGLTTHEVQKALQAGFIPIKIHGNLLRAETAAISAIALAQAQFAV